MEVKGPQIRKYLVSVTFTSLSPGKGPFSDQNHLQVLKSASCVNSVLFVEFSNCLPCLKTSFFKIFLQASDKSLSGTMLRKAGCIESQRDLPRYDEII